MQQLFLKKREDRSLQAGCLWIFSNVMDVSLLRNRPAIYSRVAQSSLWHTALHVEPW